MGFLPSSVQRSRLHGDSEPLGPAFLLRLMRDFGLICFYSSFAKVQFIHSFNRYFLSFLSYVPVPISCRDTAMSKTESDLFCPNAEIDSKEVSHSECPQWGSGRGMRGSGVGSAGCLFSVRCQCRLLEKRTQTLQGGKQGCVSVPS